MKKRIWCTILISLIAVVLLYGCGSKKEDKKNSADEAINVAFDKMKNADEFSCDIEANAKISAHVGLSQINGFYSSTTEAYFKDEEIHFENGIADSSLTNGKGIYGGGTNFEFESYITNMGEIYTKKDDDNFERVNTLFSKYTIIQLMNNVINSYTGESECKNDNIKLRGSIEEGVGVYNVYINYLKATGCGVFDYPVSTHVDYEMVISKEKKIIKSIVFKLTNVGFIWLDDRDDELEVGGSTGELKFDFKKFDNVDDINIPDFDSNEEETSEIIEETKDSEVEEQSGSSKISGDMLKRKKAYSDISKILEPYINSKSDGQYHLYSVIELSDNDLGIYDDIDNFIYYVDKDGNPAEFSTKNLEKKMTRIYNWDTEEFEEKQVEDYQCEMFSRTYTRVSDNIYLECDSSRVSEYYHYDESDKVFSLAYTETIVEQSCREFGFGNNLADFSRTVIMINADDNVLNKYEYEWPRDDETGRPITNGDLYVVGGTEFTKEQWEKYQSDVLTWKKLSLYKQQSNLQDAGSSYINNDFWRSEAEAG